MKHFAIFTLFHFLQIKAENKEKQQRALLQSMHLSHAQIPLSMNTFKFDNMNPVKTYSRETIVTAL